VTDIEAIRRRLANTTTPGPWDLGVTSTVYMDGRSAFTLRTKDKPGIRIGLTATREDAVFIAHARQDIEDLLAVIEHITIISPDDLGWDD